MGISERGKAVVQTCITAGYELGGVSVVTQQVADRLDAARNEAESFIASLEFRLREATLDSARLDELERLCRDAGLIVSPEDDGSFIDVYKSEGWVAWIDRRVATLREAADASLKSPAVSASPSGGD